jgi:hypothetical protein
LGKVAGRKGANTVTRRKRLGALIEPEFSFAVAGIGAVAGKTVVRENGPDVLVE